MADNNNLDFDLRTVAEAALAVAMDAADADEGEGEGSGTEEGGASLTEQEREEAEAEGRRLMDSIPGGDDKEVVLTIKFRISPRQYLERFGIELPEGDDMDIVDAGDGLCDCGGETPLSDAEDATVTPGAFFWNKQNKGAAYVKKYVKATLQQCQAKNPATCPFHGAQAIGQDIEAELQKQGLNVPVNVELITYDNAKGSSVLSVSAQMQIKKKDVPKAAAALAAFGKNAGVYLDLKQADLSGGIYDVPMDIDLLDPNAKAAWTAGGQPIPAAPQPAPQPATPAAQAPQPQPQPAAPASPAPAPATAPTPAPQPAQGWQKALSGLQGRTGSQGVSAAYGTVGNWLNSTVGAQQKPQAPAPQPSQAAQQKPKASANKPVKAQPTHPPSTGDTPQGQKTPAQEREGEIADAKALAGKSSPKTRKAVEASMKAMEKAHEGMKDFEDNIGALDAAISMTTDPDALKTLQDYLKDVEKAYGELDAAYKTAKAAIDALPPDAAPQDYSLDSIADTIAAIKARGEKVHPYLKNWQKQQNKRLAAAKTYLKTMYNFTDAEIATAEKMWRKNCRAVYDALAAGKITCASICHGGVSIPKMLRGERPLGANPRQYNDIVAGCFGSTTTAATEQEGGLCFTRLIDGKAKDYPNWWKENFAVVVDPRKAVLGMYPSLYGANSKYGSNFMGCLSLLTDSSLVSATGENVHKEALTTDLSNLPASQLMSKMGLSQGNECIVVGGITRDNASMIKRFATSIPWPFTKQDKDVIRQRGIKLIDADGSEVSIDSI